jgi:deoxyribodipyrimidine photolyase-related protein
VKNVKEIKPPTLTMHNIFIVFPNHLFENITPLRGYKVYLVEEYLYFTQYKFHQQKIAYHRSTMQQYKHYLTNQKIEVTYMDAQQPTHHVSMLVAELAKQGYTQITTYELSDDWLSRKLTNSCKQNKISIHTIPSPLFLNTLDELKEYFDNKKSYFQTDFYTAQRKKRNILLDHAQKPIGGKWTYDAENRLKYPKDKLAPTIKKLAPSKYNKEAAEYVAIYYPNNYGTICNKFDYPTNHTDAKAWLNEFLQQRFHEFGIYEDAIVDKELILHHSVLSPMLNNGLLTPDYVVRQIIFFSNKNNIAINNTEGIIRQIIGWREFIRGVYIYKGSKERTTNFWNFSKKIPASFYTGTTGIVPVDDTIKKVLATGYCHHIERLMILGNFMLLCEFDPNEVYKWFMELFIDAYDWVMVPNVYGMSQFADGGLMATKPYISGSNYIFKMSNYKKTNQPQGWDAIWDGLFWRFMHIHRSFFLQNPRLGMLVNTFDKMSEDKKKNHLLIAEKFLDNL